MPKTIVALVPARSGSQRIRGKNVRLLHGHPLIAYSIAVAIDAGIFARIVVSTDSQEYADIARQYGAEAPFLRPPEIATPTSPDVEWIRHALTQVSGHTAFAILRPTSPFRSAATLHRAWERLQSLPGADSLRAVERVRQHPGKMWVVSDDGDSMKPLLEQSNMALPLHSQQYASLPAVYVQNSSLEMVWTDAVTRTGRHAGDVVAPFIAQGMEGFSLDYENEWRIAEEAISDGRAALPSISPSPAASPTSFRTS